MDFTLRIYNELLDSIIDYDFESLVLRHDVDLLPMNSLRMACLEARKGVFGIYYFRAVPESWDEGIIHEINAQGHEIGYHYESLTTCHGDIDAAYSDFCRHLDELRRLVPVKSICMHGSPRSAFDSKDIWKKYNYRALGIENEPYLDTDFSKVFYLTDTGRRWDGYKVSVRDKIPHFQDKWAQEGLTFHSTSDIIEGLRRGIIPKRLMMTVHPQRWNSFGLDWCKELLLQSAKNVVKRVIVMKKS